MAIVHVALILLLVVALSGTVLRLLPVKLPLPLVQIGLGVLLRALPTGLHVRFDPELFFVLFIPPLLFADGWRMPQREFRQLRVPILALALGLVFVTVVAVGGLVHWLMPAVPLAVAFALAAVLSPTDAVAVGSITGGTRMPRQLLHVLEGEALMNDASGLVSMQFAVAAVVTGVFSLADASLRFLWVAAGGLGIGYLVTWLFGQAHRRLVRWSGELDPASQTTLLLLLPFAAYLLAERIGVSGILAAVAAGMALNRTEVMRGGNARARIENTSVWGMLEFAFNGVIFLLLGLQLPGIVVDGRDAWRAGGGHLWTLCGLVVLITLALMLLRLAWISAWVRAAQVLARWRGRAAATVRRRTLWVATFAGVHGALTLAGVLSLPIALPDGTPFPARPLLVFIAAGVILTTLLAGSVGLPPLLRNLELPPETGRMREERRAREQSARAALDAVQQRLRERAGADRPDSPVREVAERITADYRSRLAATGEGEGPLRARRERLLERELRLEALRAQRVELYRLHHEKQIDDGLLRALVRELDLAEASLGSVRAARGGTKGEAAD